MTDDPSLFEQSSSESADPADHPLAYRMRPRDFSEFVGQEHAVGPSTPLRTALEADRLISLILQGPPGTGKTALAHLIATETSSHVARLNAVLAGKDDLREVLDEARDRRSIQDQGTILFLDEIHRFNKAQQDALLPPVEEGLITLVGATTQNPRFYIINPLLSRSLLVRFHSLTEEDLGAILDRTLGDERGLDGEYELTGEARTRLIQHASGDARRLLNGLDIAARSVTGTRIDEDHLEGALQEEFVEYDRDADHHYNVASALIKSIRGSDPDAAIYYLAKMLEAGEDPRFIARRLVIAASEDIGNADPRALPLTIAAKEAVEFVGMPEAQIPLAQATTYLASRPKSNAAYQAVKEARKAIQNGLDLPVPAHLRDPNATERRETDADEEAYEYPHDHPGGFVRQTYWSGDRTWYRPTDHGYEKHLADYLAGCWDSSSGSTD